MFISEIVGKTQCLTSYNFATYPSFYSTRQSLGLFAYPETFAHAMDGTIDPNTTTANGSNSGSSISSTLGPIAAVVVFVVALMVLGPSVF